METLGNRIRKARGTLSQDAFCALIEVSKGSLGFYERDENLPKIDVITKICSKTGVSVEWLVTGIGPMWPDATQAQQPLAQTPAMPQTGCPECAALKLELAKEREERRELSAENRLLWRENGELKERVARLEERASRGISPSGFTDESAARTA